MTMTPDQAQVVGKYFKLTPDETIWLTAVPYRNTSAELKSDPIIHRFYEVCYFPFRKAERQKNK